MLRCLFVVLIAMLFVSGSGKLSFAQDDYSKNENVTGAGVASSVFGATVNVGNKICPVSGDKIGKGMEAVTYEYQGKIYNFCCEGCIPEFKKDPDKYIKKVNEELSQELKDSTK
jgi:YHS domain-containing protein